MLRNYIKIAWRNLIRNRAFSTINIVGLAIGLASCMLISLYVIDELSFDRYNDKATQIYRVIFKGSFSGGKINEANVMPPTAQTIKNDYPEVLEATRLRQVGYQKVIVGNKQFSGDRTAFVDPNFFEVFTLPFTSGSSSSALTEPNTIVLTERAAQKFYGKENIVGNTLRFKGSDIVYKVTGVMKNIPDNSHFNFDLLVSMTGFEDAKSTSWMISEFFTYLLLPEDYDYKALEAKLPKTVDKYLGPQLKTSMGMTMEEFRKKGNSLGLFLQPLLDIHLHSDFAYDLGLNGDITYVYIFGAIAVIMLLIACINFMNLSTAGATKRAREVGVRKVMGSQKSELVWQFLLESILLTLLALSLAAILAYFALPLFNEISGKNLSFQPSFLPRIIPGLFAFGLFIGLLAGSYPAFFLSSFKPISVLKGKLLSTNRGINMRQGLVVVQFFISIVLMIGTMVVYQQLKFISTKKLGYEKEHVLIVDSWPLGKNQNAFKGELLRDPQVLNVSASSFIPAGDSYSNNYTVYPENQFDQLVKTLRYDVDENYIPTMGMEIVSGRNFSKEFGNDSTGVIINETAAKLLGWGKDALNHTLTNTANDGSKGTFRVIGVVKDFHFRSLHEAIAPLVMVLRGGGGNFIVKVKAGDTPQLLSSMKTKWEAFKPDMPLTYSFLNERYNNTYLAEQKTGKILGIFAGLNIFVACLGLFGLATFMAEQRTKEIGVRKVLGASVTSVVGLLSKEFLKPVAIALLFAAPLAWYGMDRWLQNFAYRTNIAWWIFAAAGLLSICVALFTVSFQSVKTALLNPVKSLRAD